VANARDIKRLLEAAFLGVQRDAACTLHQAQLADQSLSRKISQEEWGAAGRLDPETDWRDVPAAALDECGAALSHATPRSWHFYLPAYMRRALDLIDEPTWESVGSVVFHLTYTEKNNLAAYWLERFHQLNEAQARAVTAFLEFVRDYSTEGWSYADDARLALKKYWVLPPERRPPGTTIIRIQK
jgi:hypothetical protein